MAISVSELSVFVSSPGDVCEEREALAEVVSELNSLWRTSKAVRLVLVRWETDAYPSFGFDAQSVINEQIGDNYDIFVGILSGKFGTQTSRAGSGTEEEFRRAYERYKINADELRILFYFKDAEIKLSEVDLEQLALIRKFKSELGELGSLYWQYKDKDEFCRFLRLHLTRHVEDWGKTWGTGEAVPKEASLSKDMLSTEDVIMTNDIVVDDEGLLDIIESGSESIINFNESMSRITGALCVLGEKTEKRTEEVTRINADGGGVDIQGIRAMKRICNHAAEDLLQFSKVVDAELPLFVEAFGKAIDSYSRVISMMPDFNEREDLSESIQNAKSTLSEMKIAVTSSLGSTLSFRETIARQPRMTSEFNRAKRKAVASLDHLIEEMQSTCYLIEESEKSFDYLLNNDVISQS